jgi:hypothetical protein
MTKEYPIILHELDIKAILDGRKTQMRLPITNLAVKIDGKVDLLLWVRETWAVQHDYDSIPSRLVPKDAARLYYAASCALGGLMSRPSIHMPRWASRITLQITDVRKERLQDISDADAIAEGIYIEGGMFRNGSETEYDIAKDAFAVLWESIYGHGSWEVNPLVWVITFRAIEGILPGHGIGGQNEHK